MLGTFYDLTIFVYLSKQTPDIADICAAGHAWYTFRSEVLYGNRTILEDCAISSQSSSADWFLLAPFLRNTPGAFKSRTSHSTFSTAVLSRRRFTRCGSSFWTRLLASGIVTGIFFTGIFLSVVHFHSGFKKTTVEPDYEPKLFDPYEGKGRA